MPTLDIEGIESYHGTMNWQSPWGGIGGLILLCVAIVILFKYVLPIIFGAH